MTVAEGWYRGRLGFRGGRREIYGADIGPIAQLELHYDDGTHRHRGDRSPVAGRPRRAPLGQPLRRRDLRRPARRTGVVDGRLRRQRLGRRRRAGRRWPTGWSPRPGRRSAGSRRCARWPSSRRRAASPSSTSGRTSPAGSASPCAARPATRSPCATPRCSTTASWPPGCCARRRPPTPTCSPARRRRDLRAGVHDPRVPLRQVDGWPGTSSTRTSIEAVVCHSDMPATGTFDCSDERLNQLHENVRWSMRGNFVDVPTDCPQRDERLGWTGDIQVFAPTAAFLYDCCGLPRVVAGRPRRRASASSAPCRPTCRGSSCSSRLPPAAAWGDAAVVVPWVLYERFGDVDVLRRQYDSMRAWVDQIAALAGDDHLWDEGFQFGDWLDPAAPPATPAPRAPTPRWSPPPTTPTRLGCSPRTAGVLGHDGRPGRYDELADRITAAFNAEFVTPTGRMASDAQTAYALALRFDLLPTEAQRAPRRRPPGRARAPRGLPHRHRLRRHAARVRRPGRRRLRRRRLPPAAADAVPVVAVPGHDGRDDRVGALGQHAAGRLDQPHRDDLVQPLRPRRRRRLPAPRRRRAGPRRARLPQAARPPASRRRAHPRRGDAAHPVRRRQRALEATRRSARRRRRRADRQHGTVELPGTRRRRRRPGDAPVRRCRTARPRSTRPGRPDPSRSSPSSTRTTSRPTRDRRDGAPTGHQGRRRPRRGLGRHGVERPQPPRPGQRADPPQGAAGDRRARVRPQRVRAAAARRDRAGRSPTSCSPSRTRSSPTSPRASRRSPGATASPCSSATATATRHGRRTTSSCSSSSVCAASSSARSTQQTSQLEQLRRRGIAVVLVDRTSGPDVVQRRRRRRRRRRAGRRPTCSSRAIGASPSSVVPMHAGAWPTASRRPPGAGGAPAAIRDSLTVIETAGAQRRRGPAGRRTARRAAASPAPDRGVLRQRPGRPRAAPADDADRRRRARRAGDRRLRRHRVRRRGGRAAQLGPPAPRAARPHRRRAAARRERQRPRSTSTSRSCSRPSSSCARRRPR